MNTRKRLVVFLLILAIISACAPTSAENNGLTNAPQAWFDAPLPGTVHVPPNPCMIVAHGASPAGISQFELSINGANALALPSPDTSGSLVTLTQDCGVTEPGEYFLQLRAQDNGGNWSAYAETSLIVEGGTSTSTPAPAPANCIDKLDVASESPLQKSHMLPGQQFTKTWTIQNTGSCAWGDGYRLVFTGGPSMSEGAASMGGVLDTPLGSLVSLPVLPAQKISLTLNQIAPTSEGWYVGAWNLVAPNGGKIPITYSGADSMPSMYADIVVKAGTPTPPAGAITVERISTNLVYIGGTNCGATEVTFTARAVSSNITAVVLFYRFQTNNSSTEFQGIAMNPTGGDLYERTINPTSALGGAVPFDAATLQYQIVIQQTDGDTSIRTPVFSDITAQACGGGGSTSSCSQYTDKRACISNSCNWVEIPGVVPIYECRAP